MLCKGRATVVFFSAALAGGSRAHQTINLTVACYIQLAHAWLLSVRRFETMSVAVELGVIHELLLHRASVVGNVTVDDGAVVAEDLRGNVALAHARVRLLA